MNKSRIIFITVLLLFFAGSLYSQIESISDLDKECEAVSEQIKQYFNSVSGNNGVEIGVFALSGSESPLGRYWRLYLLNLLAGTSGLTVYATSGTAANFVIAGEMVDLGQTIRVFTRIINKADNAVFASWSNDLGKTQFLLSLPQQTSSSGRTIVPRDIYEDDSWENPVPVNIGDPPISRTIHDGEDRDWFLIRPATGIFVALETSGSMDTFMELYDEERNRLAEDDDDGEGENARILYFLEGGKSYIAMVRGYSDETGHYQFFVRETQLPDHAMEPNDTMETAFPIEIGKDINAYLAPNDLDWYVFSVKNPGQVQIRTSGRIDKQLSLYDNEGRQLAMADDSESDTNANISRFLESGAYYILVQGKGRNPVGIYGLRTRIRENAVIDSYEPDDTPEQANEIKIGEVQRHSFSDGSDVDWVFFIVESAGIYIISAKGEKNNNLDTEIGLYDENLKLLAEDDDGGPGYSSLLRQRLSPGRYYIRVICLDDEPDDFYLLTVERN